MDRSTPLAMGLRLPPDERIRLVQDLWDSIADDPGVWELTDEQRILLDERLAGYESDRDSGRPWREVVAETWGAVTNTVWRTGGDT